MIRLPLLAFLLLPALAACSGEADAPKDADVGDTDTGDTDTGDTDTGDTADTGDAEDIALAGDWYDNWGGRHTITNEAWNTAGATYILAVYDNASSYAIAQNGPDNEWNPGLWSRFDWGTQGNDVVYCQTAYDAASQEDATATTPADITDPDAGCNGFAWTVLRASFTLADRWDDALGGSHAIDPFTWTSGESSWAIARIDDEASWLVAQNASANPTNPGLWSRFDWALDAEGARFVCQVTGDAASEKEAVGATPPNPGDLISGCGGSAWTEIRPALSIGGAWMDAYDTLHVINAFAWRSGYSQFQVQAADDDAGWLVAQNGAANEWNPGLWSRFDWTWDADDQLWYCQTAYAAESEEAALATPAADATAPGTGGCGGFAWTSLSPTAAR